nr:hypothetical protein [Gammaproteobacteria bacterium]
MTEMPRSAEMVEPIELQRPRLWLRRWRAEDLPALAARVSFTTAGNERARRLMEAIGLRRDPPGDFLHPRLSDGRPLCPHPLYRLCREDWEAAHG